MNVQTRRHCSILKDKIDKIINEAIKYHLEKLENSAKLMKLSQDGQKTKFQRESWQARLTIQHLMASLKELDNCYSSLIEADCETKLDPYYSTKISEIKKQVSKKTVEFLEYNKQINQRFIDEEQQNHDSDFENINHQTLKVLETELDTVKVKKQYKEVESLNRDIIELNKLAVDLGKLVHEQQSQIDQIENNIESTEANVTSGTESLIKASATTIAPLACAALGATIFGPIGALITFKLSTGLATAFGGSVLSYSVASHVKKKKIKQAQVELDDMKSLSNLKK